MQTTPLMCSATKLRHGKSPVRNSPFRCPLHLIYRGDVLAQQSTFMNEKELLEAKLQHLDRILSLIYTTLEEARNENMQKLQTPEKVSRQSNNSECRLQVLENQKD